MSKIVIPILALILILPQVSLASEMDCKNEGYSIVYVNGIFTKDFEADDSLKRIAYFIDKYSTNADNITMHLGYNPTRSGLDLIKATMQAYSNPTDEQIDQDAKRILAQLHNDLSTKRILLLGHSQGTFYTNALYTYLRENGINRDAIAVYNIGTPASYVNGVLDNKGDYITNSTDNVINDARTWAKMGNALEPLPANVHIPLQDDQTDNESRGHDLQRVYLAGEGERIVREIDALLDTLIVPEIALSEGGCYFAPEFSWRDTLKKLSIDTVGGVMGGLSKVRVIAEAAKNQINNIISLSKKEIQPRYEQRTSLDEPIIPAQETSTKEQQELPRQIQKKKQVTIPTEAIQPTMSYEQMSLLLSQLKIMLEDKLVLLQPRDKCAGIDLSIMKYSTCLSPFEEGGFGFGAGGGMMVCDAPSNDPSSPCYFSPPVDLGEWTLN